MAASRGPLDEVLNYPLLSALLERRSRRVVRGTSIDSGALSHTSTNAPAPLSPLEEAVLIVVTGLSGITTHDGPLDVPSGGKELGTPFLNILARSASSPDNSQPTRFFLINDEGIWLIKRLQGAEALAVARDLPPRWSDWQEADWIAAAAAVKTQVSPQRLEFPRQYPYYLGWNRQLSNRPGSSMFLPVTDVTPMYINGILNLIEQPPGQRPLFLDDWRGFEPKNPEDVAGWVAEHLGLAPDIPYQPIGGVARARGGYVNPQIVVPLGIAGRMLSDHEAYFLQQNLMLVAQAMGLGAWVHVCVQSPYVFQQDSTKGWHGLGFRMEKPTKTWHRWPPLPASQPNPVGIDGLLEGRCPPYVTSMSDAVDRLLEEKRAAYADAQIFARSYADPALMARFQQDAAGYTPETIVYAKEICEYIVDTYGRFPAHADAFALPGTWVQIGHLELEYYEKYFAPFEYRRQADHARIWNE